MRARVHEQMNLACRFDSQSNFTPFVPILTHEVVGAAAGLRTASACEMPKGVAATALATMADSNALRQRVCWRMV